LAFNLTEHNITQPFLDDKTTDEQVCDQASTQVIVSQQQEVLTISPSLLSLRNSVSTTALPCRTSSPIHFQVADSEQVYDLPRLHGTALQKKHCCLIDGCGKSFARPQELQRHQAGIHGLGSKVLQCPGVGCAYTTEKRRKHNLGRHVSRYHPTLLSIVDGL